MFCYVDRYFVILFCLLHFLFQRVLVSVSLVSEYDLVTYTQGVYIYTVPSTNIGTLDKCEKMCL